MTQELTQAKRTITDLEYHFQSEKTELRRISSEHTKALKEREKIAEKLKETEQVNTFYSYSGECQHYPSGNGADKRAVDSAKDGCFEHTR